MSEFSESLQLLGTGAEGASLMRRAGVPGWVVPGKRWTALLCATDGGEIQRIINVNTGILLHYAYAEDHGCDVHLIRGPRRAGYLKCYFELESWHFDVEAFVDGGLLTEEAGARLCAYVELAHEPSALEQLGRYLPAESLGLEHYRWLSHAYAVADGGGDGWIRVDGA